jgi:hypothetical protein
MHIFAVGLALLALAAAPAPKPPRATTVPSAPGDGWQTFRDPAGVFSAEFPEKPTTQKQTSGAPGHSVATIVYAVNTGTSAFMVIVSDMSALSLTAKQASESAMASIALGKTPLSNKAIKLGKRTGRIVTAEDANTLYTAQIYFFNHRLIQAITARPKSATPEEIARADRFQNSFKLK